MRKIIFTLVAVSTILSTRAQFSEGGLPLGFKFGDLHNVPVITLPAFDVQQLLIQDSLRALTGNKYYRFGNPFTTDYNLNNSGHWTTLEGGRLWQLIIRSENAKSLMFGFENLNLPAGAKLYIYNTDHSRILGAYTNKSYNQETQAMATDFVFGEQAVIEYYEPTAVQGQGSLKISWASHVYRGNAELAKAFGGSGSCNNNVNCPVGANYQDIKKSVVCLVSGGSGFCTGALVNNTSNDGTPYVLTANHCLSGANAPATLNGWSFRFNWEAVGCTNPTVDPVASSTTLSGGQLVANNSGSDVALVRITAPNAIATLTSIGAVYAGWDRTTTVASSAVGIHHPSGDIKKISFTQTANTSTTWGNPTAQVWQTGTWTDGITEPGSSGSPLFNPAKRIVGQLFGGPSSCAAENNPASGFDYYGRFDISWNNSTQATGRLRDWLDPSNLGPNTLDMYDPNAVVITLDTRIQSVTSPTGNLCSGNNIVPVVVLKNNGTQTITSVAIKYAIDNGTFSTFNWTGSLATGQTSNVNLPAVNTTPGAHTFRAATLLPNGGTDLNPANDTAASTFTVLNVSPVTLPFTQGFEGTFPPTGWTVTNPQNAGWASANVGGFGTSSKSAFIDNYSTTTSLAGNIDDLTTPYIDVTSAGTPFNLTFDVAYARYNATYFDSLFVQASTDCGTTWTTVYSKGNSALATAPDNSTSNFSPTASQWRTETVSLNAFAGGSPVQLRFRNVSGWGNNAYIDNVNLSYTNNNTPPTATFTVQPTACTGQTVSLNNSSQNATSYQWNFGGGTGSSTTDANPTVTFSSAGTYTITLTASNASGNNQTTQTINVSQTPATPTVSNNGPVCAGSDLNLSSSAAPGGNYVWTGPNGFSSNVQNPTISAATGSASGVYSLYIVQGSCSSSVATTTASVSNNPVTTIQQNGTTLSVTGTFAGYQWYLNGTPIAGATSSSYSLTQNGTFTVEVTNNNGCKGTASFTVSNVSVEESALQAMVTIFPNPASDMITVQNLIPGTESVRISVINTLGEYVKDIRVAEGVHNTNISLTNLAAGVYTVRITKGNTTVVRRLIKK